jgi:sulfite reductase beta subunit-like hemoprotein
VKLADAEAAMRLLAQSGLTTREACGNTVRNVTACPHAGTLESELFDVTPYADAVVRHFLRNPFCQKLPRKFKIALSACADDCAFTAIHDIGLRAAVRDVAGVPMRGFRVVAGGGLSTSPENAHLVEEFVTTNEVLPVCEAIVRVFDRCGNRENKARARLKYVFRKLGDAGFRAEYEKELAAVRARVGDAGIPIVVGDDETTPLGTLLPFVPQGDGRDEPRDRAAYRRFSLTNVHKQRQAGYVSATVRLHRGDVTAVQLRALADAVTRFADGTLRTTVDQNLLVRFITEGALPAFYRALEEMGLADAGAGTISDVTACPGADSCNLAITHSRDLASALTDRLTREDALAALASNLHIKISGCPNSCGQHHIAGIGFHGAARRLGTKMVPAYQLHLGGGANEGGAVFGRQPVKIPAARVADAVVRLLALYRDQRNPGEEALAFFRRVDIEVVKARLADLAGITPETARPADYQDLGTNVDFQLHTGEGECAA